MKTYNKLKPQIYIHTYEIISTNSYKFNIIKISINSTLIILYLCKMTRFFEYLIILLKITFSSSVNSMKLIEVSQTLSTNDGFSILLKRAQSLYISFFYIANQLIFENFQQRHH